MTNATAEKYDSVLTDWETEGWKDRVAQVSSDPESSPSIIRILTEALEQAPADAIKDAEIVYRILLERACVETDSEWKWRSHTIWCWACNSHNTRLVGAPEYGIVHDCLDCGDQFLVDGTIQWDADSENRQPQ